MMAPMPSAVSCHTPSVRFRVGPSPSCGSISASPIILVRNRRVPPGWESLSAIVLSSGVEEDARAGGAADRTGYDPKTAMDDAR